MLNAKKISIGNAAAKITVTSPSGITTGFIPINSDVSTAYLRIATAEPHNFFVGGLVTVTGLKNNWLGGFSVGYVSFLAPIIAKPILRIDDPYSFCIAIPYPDAVSKTYIDFAPFTGATSAADGYIYPYATAYLVNGQLNSINIKYAQS